ncbi:hypothetical protein GYMLUDRAFT_64591 [Collybiopsis luxurians FD-317 M1]|uniref:Uncharacterized protein n=1 Tax=Collybiopsis luxurians FD-317 M1 TaxID=944289 RepID=A0A0D0ANL7_9AGAR|nr:hypothetical protein GYMLUDRAFT_64591 [Collybiopsis luxurians FD-317 M1]
MLEFAHERIRHRQVGQTSILEAQKCDLRAELLSVEREVRNKKCKVDGKPSEEEEVESKPEIAGVVAHDEVNKRRKMLQVTIEMDKDDIRRMGKTRTTMRMKMSACRTFCPAARLFRQRLFSLLKLSLLSDNYSDEEEDDTAELLQELDKIK